MCPGLEQGDEETEMNLTSILVLEVLLTQCGRFPSGTCLLLAQGPENILYSKSECIYKMDRAGLGTGERES